MTYIPADIQKAADLAYDRIIVCEPSSSFSANVIAEAILAERERCANIVFQNIAPDQGESVDPKGIEILRAIRASS